MSGIFLQSLDAGPPIEIPLTKTVIGRGPFLQVTDKRVSRSHAELSVVDDTLYITPTHTNPCFLRRRGVDSQVALPRDEKCKLDIGDVIGLLPDQLFYTVCGKGGVVNGNSTAQIKNEDSSHASSTLKASQKTPKDEDASLDTAGKRKRDKVKVEGDGVVKVPGKQTMAMPLDKKRVLPNWMIQMAAVGPVPVKKKAAPKIPAVMKRGDETSPRKRTPAKPYRDEDDDDYEDEELPPAREKKRAPPARKRNERKRKTESDDEEDARPRRRPRPARRAGLRDEDDDDDAPQPRRPERAARQSRGSYVEDFLIDEESEGSIPDHLKHVKDDDSDFEMDDGADSGSDWENKGKAKKGKGNKAKIQTPRRTPGRSRGRPRKKYDEDKDDDDDDDPDAYVPRPSKRRGGGTKRKKDESEEEEEEEEVKKPAKKKTVNKKRKKCEFGKKCYRKNPVHFEDYCHPGDASYDNDSEKSDEDDDDKPECEFGVDCYRQNAQHRKEYSHKKKKTADRPQRKSRNDGKKSVLDKDEDDDGGPNTYDYNDSFLDDRDLTGSESSYGDPDEDSDYEPGEEEDVKSLMKEAKGFVKKKKMRQPVGKKIEITPD